MLSRSHPRARRLWRKNQQTRPHKWGYPLQHFQQQQKHKKTSNYFVPKKEYTDCIVAAPRKFVNREGHEAFDKRTHRHGATAVDTQAGSSRYDQQQKARQTIGMGNPAAQHRVGVHHKRHKITKEQGSINKNLSNHWPISKGGNTSKPRGNQ